MGIVVQTSNPLAPWRNREVTRVPHDMIIADWLDENGVVFTAPTICLRNGEALMRIDWESQLIGDQDIIAFVTLPQGGKGGGSGILQIVMMLAVVVAAAFTGGAAAAAYGSAFGVAANSAGALAAGALASGIVMAAGSMLTSMLMPPANPLSSLQSSAMSAASPTYSLQAQGNSARLGSSIPVIYGKHRVYPDFAAQPYTEYADNEQYLYQLLCIGQGEYDVLDMRIEDSPISSFDEITYTVYGPNELVTAFPSGVENSGEVAGQELLTGAYIGHFFANTAGSEINRIGIDIVAPNGMFFANDSGGLSSRSAVFQVEAAKYNEVTGALGTFAAYLTETISAASSTPIRRTYKFNVSPGRYAVRVKRINAKDGGARASDAIAWAGMRGYIPGVQNYGGVTMLAMVMKATNNLSSASSRRINCLVQRKLKSWHPATGWSAVATATRSIVWALADVAKADYGLKLADSKIDLPGFYELDQLYISRQALFGANDADYVDIVFDNRVGAMEALANIAQCGRAMPVIQGAMLRVVRDTQQAIPTALFSVRNIVKGSFSINYLMPNDQTADAVIIEWIDKDSLQPKETKAVLPGSTEINPARLKMTGISSNAQAFREGITQAAANRYRRKLITFQTELEGHIPIVGDLVAVSHPMPNWGTSGELVAISGLDFTLSEPVEFVPATTHYIGLRKPDGSVSGPHVCVAHISGDSYKVTIQAGTVLDFVPTVADDREHTYFAFGPAGEMYMQARVLPPIRPRGNNIVEISCTNENSAVHSAELGLVPALPEPWQLPKKITKPVISRLDVTQGGTAANPILLLSWAPAANAEHYLIQSSTNNADWLSHPETSATSTSIKVEPGAVWVRIAAVGLARGEWITWSGTTGEIPAPGNVSGLASVEAFTGTKARVNWSPVLRANYYKVEVWALGVLRNSSTTTATAFDYSAEDVTRAGGPWRALTFKVFAGNQQGESLAPAEITLTNPQVPVLAGINVYAGIKSAVITYSRPSDTDFAGIRVCQGLVAGFTPDDTNVVYEGGDSVIVVPDLLEGTDYYFRLAAFDGFGKDSLIYTGEYHAFISSANAPTPEEIKAGLQTALDTASNPLVFNTDAFAIKLDGVDKTPFIVGSVDGVASVLLDANVAVMGSLSANQIRSGRLAATENIIIGNGNAVINGDGSILTYSGDDSLANRDFSLLTGGNLSFQRYRGGAYQQYKSVRRVEYGQANSGETVTLPGYWDTQPKIIVSPASITSYNAAQSGASQSWTISADNITEVPALSGIWRFDAMAELNFSASYGTITAAAGSGNTATDSYYSSESTLPINTVSITVTAKFSSVKGDGISSNNYYFRSVTWKIEGWNGTSWVQLGIKTRDILQNEHGQQVIDSNPVSTAGYSKIRLFFVSSNTNGAKYALNGAGDTYNYSNDTILTNGTTAQAKYQTGISPGITINIPTAILNGPAYPARDASWSIYAVTYNAEWQHYVYLNGDSTGQTNSAYGIHHFGSAMYDQTSEWTPVTTGIVSTTTYDHNFWTANVSGSSGIASKLWTFTVRNASATVYVRQVQTNDPASQNNFIFQSYAWNIAGSTAIATGSLNWMAIGD